MKNVPIYPFEHYLIDECGDVYSTRRGGNRAIERSEPLKLVPYIDDDGYKQFRLANKKISKRFSGHFLVAITFIGPRPFMGAEIRHLNGDPADNRISNLRWGSRKENGEDKVIHGRSSFGEKNVKAKLTKSEVLAIRSAAKSGIIKMRLAEIYGITSAQVSKITLGQVWKHV